tara:strand:- start:113 stop:289 length:177 start_codon:yes stop_codon:yes gene_type:complete
MSQTEERRLRLISQHVNRGIENYDILWSRDLKNILTHEINLMRKEKLLKVLKILELIE